MAEFDTRERFASSPVAQLATAGADGVPHLVPVVFAVGNGVIYTAVDAKRKSTHRLRRMANIEANPAVSLIVDHYDDDWSQLWWVRADGTARVLDDGDERDRALDLLAAKHAQYRDRRPAGPVVAIDVSSWSEWHG